MKSRPAHQGNPGFHVLIAAAGQGSRFSGKIPKQYNVLGGKPVLRHVIEKFLPLPGLKSLRVIIDLAHDAHYRQAVAGLDLPPPVHGAAERSLSVRNALRAMTGLEPDDIVLVHDAARPLVEPEDITNLIRAMQDSDAASLAVPVSDTLRRSGNDNSAEDIVNRDGLWSLQTPQAFRFGVLKTAHETVDGVFTDDTSLVSATGTPVKLVPGSRANIKITLPEDFLMAEKLLAQPWETRTGMGYDVHAFSKDKNRPLMLCGVKVDHPFGLDGHSDADPGLHALTDAILGAIGAGDIGLHFPPDNPEYRNMDSSVFLKAASDAVAKKNGIIANADITLICEAPKIGPYRETMQRRVAEILGIDPGRVNIKATTTEGLGFTGRGEGIAAQAVANIELPG